MRDGCGIKGWLRHSVAPRSLAIRWRSSSWRVPSSRGAGRGASSASDTSDSLTTSRATRLERPRSSRRDCSTR